MQLNHTHDPAATSWVASANMAGGGFPIQNLPFAVFRHGKGGKDFRGGVAIGDQVVDLAQLSAAGSLDGLAARAAAVCAQPSLNEFFAMGPVTAPGAARPDFVPCSRRDYELEPGVFIGQDNAQEKQGRAPSRLSHTSFRPPYWTLAQMVAHHTVGGCNLRPGDLPGSGTISGPSAAEAGTLIELAEGGRKPVTLDNGDQRGFLQDGDAVILKGWCEKPGCARIGFGQSRGEILPALTS